MTLRRNALVFSLFFILTEVAPWTIDLPEVRRYLFEKYSKESKGDYEDYVHSDQRFYSNIQGNSMHNSEGHYDNQKYENQKYANDYGYQSYMEKKVKEIVHDGGVYLEGLRGSLENYSRYLEDCNRRNMSTSQNATSSNSTWTPPAMPSSFNQTMMFNSSAPQFPDSNSTNWVMRQLGLNTSSELFNTTRTRERMSCREATEKSEKVRRYADLAMWATRRLQDLAYAGKYQKTDKYEENELILKLAWFLDQLAVLTGYEPDYKHYLPLRTTDTPTTSPIVPTWVPQTQELTNYMMNCIKMNSSEPATVRCRYPLPLNDMVQQIVGGSSTSSPQQNGGNVVPLPSDSSPQQSMELLIASDDFRTPRRITKRSPIPDEYFVPISIPVHEKPKPIVEFIVKKLSNLKAIVKSVKKHAVADFASQVAAHKHLHKRSIDDNTSVLSNQLSNESKPTVKLEPTVDIVPPIHLPVLDVSVINTKSFKKRSIDDRSASILLSNHKLTGKPTVKSVNKRSVDNPLSNLAKYYMKYKVWANDNPLHVNSNEIPTNFDVGNNLQSKTVSKRSLFFKKHRHFLLPRPLKLIQAYRHKHRQSKKGKGKLLSYIGSLLEKKHKFNKYSHKIYKRSLHYEDMYLPRIPENPVGDISYYVKNKEGTEYNPSLTQAAQVRLGLQQVFETGNIEVVRRFGSNYNPAIPAPFYNGVLKGMADS